VIVGARLAALRTSRNLTVGRLASVLGTTEDRIRQYELGLSRVTPAHVIEICQYFQIKVADLFPSPGSDQDPTED
jgi:transcriptional regulator with XRE-family HTH domain